MNTPPLFSPGARRHYGASQGQQIESVELVNARGIGARILTLGATLQALTAPDREGRFCDIALGFEKADDYRASRAHVGGIVGRYANRIGGGAFVLDGVRSTLDRNDGENTLHGGAQGFDRAIWRIAALSPRSVALALHSPDGDQGFPGAIDVLATYALAESDTTLTLTIEAWTSAPTVVALTSHAYFNLAGGESGHDILDHTLTIDADAFTPIDAAFIPTGEIRGASGAFDFSSARQIGERLGDTDDQLRLGRGYDHNYVLRKGRTRQPGRAARLAHPASGRVLEVFTSEPGVQFYSGNFLDGREIGKGGARHVRHAGLCLEPQTFPDAPNKPAFPTATLRPGETYRHRIEFRMTTDER
jgi:aldose 1-epimerase